MRASLDTNVIIHFYKADLQEILFNFFDEGVFIYEQIRKVELNKLGKIEVYTDQRLKDLAVYKIFENNVKENRNLYQAGDLGEVYAISLAQTLGAYSLVTDDTKQGGPYMSLLNFEDEVMPFTFADVLILRYLFGLVDENQTVSDFDMINTASELNWTFRSQLTKFIKRFWNDPHRPEDVVWMQKLVSEKEIKVKSKIQALRKML